jgi:hypothetical protein
VNKEQVFSIQIQTDGGSVEKYGALIQFQPFPIKSKLVFIVFKGDM